MIRCGANGHKRIKKTQKNYKLYSTMVCYKYETISVAEHYTTTLLHVQYGERVEMRQRGSLRQSY